MLDHPSVPAAPAEPASPADPASPAAASTQQRFSHVVAMAANRVIGRDGQLPWHIPEDFRIFKRLTQGHSLIMGRKTFESIGRPLPGRLSIVLTRDLHWQTSSTPTGSVVVVHDVPAAISAAAAHRQVWGDEVFIIGGGVLFAATLDLVATVYLTRVHQDVVGDTFYPELPPATFALTKSEPSRDEPRFTWEVYERRALPLPSG